MHIMASNGILGIWRSESGIQNPKQRTASGCAFSLLKRLVMGQVEIERDGF